MTEREVDHPGVHVPPPFLFVAAFVIGAAIDRRWPWEMLPVTMRAVGLVVGWSLVVGATSVAFWALGRFFRAGTAVMPNRPASQLVRRGPFRRTRNPMYVSLTVIYTGVAVLVNAVWPLLFLPLPLWTLHTYIIPREERHLSSKFGVDYDAYCARVPRWLGRSRASGAEDEFDRVRSGEHSR